MTHVSGQDVDIYDLPNEAVINGLYYGLFEYNEDPTTSSVDVVKCNNCNKYGLVERCADDCPDCKETGCLMDGFEDDFKVA